MSVEPRSARSSQAAAKAHGRDRRRVTAESWRCRNRPLAAKTSGSAARPPRPLRPPDITVSRHQVSVGLRESSGRQHLGEACRSRPRPSVQGWSSRGVGGDPRRSGLAGTGCRPGRPRTPGGQEGRGSPGRSVANGGHGRSGPRDGEERVGRAVPWSRRPRCPGPGGFSHEARATSSRGPRPPNGVAELVASGRLRATSRSRRTRGRPGRCTSSTNGGSIALDRGPRRSSRCR